MNGSWRKVTPDVPLGPGTHASVTIRAIIYGSGQPDDAWMLTLKAVQSLQGLGGVVVAGSAFSSTKTGRVKAVDRPLSSLVAQALTDGATQLLLLTAPVDLSSDFLERASRWIDADSRISTVSVLTNEVSLADGTLSFADIISRGSPDQIGRLLGHERGEIGLVSLALADGSLCILGRNALEATGGLSPEFDDDPALSIAEFSLRSSRRGFNSFLDTGSIAFVRKGHARTRKLDDDAVRRRRLATAHRFFPALYDASRAGRGTSLADALILAEAKTKGLRVLLVSTDEGPHGVSSARLDVSVRLLIQDPTILEVGVWTRKLSKALLQLSLDSKVVLIDSYERAQAFDANIVHQIAGDVGQAADLRWLGHRSVRTLDTMPRSVSQRLAAGASDMVLTSSPLLHTSLRGRRSPVARERVRLAPDPEGVNSVDGVPTPPSGLLRAGLAAERFAVLATETFAHPEILSTRRLVEASNTQLRLIVISSRPSLHGTNEQTSMPSSKNVRELCLPHMLPLEWAWVVQHAEVALMGPGQLSADLAGEIAALGTAPIGLANTKAADIADIVASPERSAAQRKAMTKAVNGKTDQDTAADLVAVYLDAMARPSWRYS